ncbi:MAG: metallophosphoesterase, partial [Burkholderiaceae bacterium]
MKIHLLSDIHLESGPYELPPDLDCDVIVAAGDIGCGTQGVQWLKTLGKPVIYVLGNHEYWSDKENSTDMFDIIDQARAEAAGSNVNFLENESVVIDGVRFLGATFWTNFGNLNPALITEANAFMMDYRHIYCPRFYANETNLQTFNRFAEEFALMSHIAYQDLARWKKDLEERYIKPGIFHPLVSYILHQRSLDWINSQLRADTTELAFKGKTVVITHHHPSYQSLVRTGIKQTFLSPNQRISAGGREPNGDLYKVAAYASDIRIMLRNWFFDIENRKNGRTPPTSLINAWLCGHLHNHLDYAHEGY